MKNILLLIALIISIPSFGQWTYEIEPHYRYDETSEIYNDSANRVYIDIVNVADSVNGEDSAVQVYYRMYDHVSGKDYVMPKNEWFPQQAFVWLVLNDISSLNKYVFSAYYITVIRREIKNR